MDEKDDALQPRLAGFASAISWLRERDVSPLTLAGAFETTPLHIRQLAFRGRRIRTVPAVHLRRLDAFADDPLGPCKRELRRSLGIRPDQDEVVVTRAKTDKLDGLEARVQRIRTELYRDLRAREGPARLAAILPELGYPSNTRAIRLVSLIRFQMAVVLIHQGLAASALEQARQAALLSRAGWDESEESIDRARLAEASLVCALAHLMRCEPEPALRHLKIHREAARAAGQRPHAEGLRLEGVCRFQLGEEEAASHSLKAAEVELIRQADAGRPQEIHEVAGFVLREAHLIRRTNFDAALETFGKVYARFRARHIIRGMHLNWTAACGLASGSPRLVREALELIDRHREETSGYGHLSSVRRLLEITPQLPAELRPSWVRRALYENAFRDR